MTAGLDAPAWRSAASRAAGVSSSRRFALPLLLCSVALLAFSVSSPSNVSPSPAPSFALAAADEDAPADAGTEQVASERERKASEPSSSSEVAPLKASSKKASKQTKKGKKTTKKKRTSRSSKSSESPEDTGSAAAERSGRRTTSRGSRQGRESAHESRSSGELPSTASKSSSDRVPKKTTKKTKRDSKSRRKRGKKTSKTRRRKKKSTKRSADDASKTSRASTETSKPERELLVASGIPTPEAAPSFSQEPSTSVPFPQAPTLEIPETIEPQLVLPTLSDTFPDSDRAPTDALHYGTASANALAKAETLKATHGAAPNTLHVADILSTGLDLPSRSSFFRGSGSAPQTDAHEARYSSFAAAGNPAQYSPGEGPHEGAYQRHTTGEETEGKVENAGEEPADLHGGAQLPGERQLGEANPQLGGAATERLDELKDMEAAAGAMRPFEGEWRSTTDAGELDNEGGGLRRRDAETQWDESTRMSENSMYRKSLSQGSVSAFAPLSSSQRPRHRLSRRGASGEEDVVILQNDRSQWGDGEAGMSSDGSTVYDPEGRYRGFARRQAGSVTAETESFSAPRRRGFFDRPVRGPFGPAFSEFDAENNVDVAEFGDAAGDVDESLRLSISATARPDAGDRDPARRRGRSEWSGEERPRRRRKSGKGMWDAGSEASGGSNAEAEDMLRLDRRAASPRGQDAVVSEQLAEAARGAGKPGENPSARDRDAAPGLTRRFDRVAQEVEKRRALEAMSARLTFEDRGGYRSGGHAWLVPGPPVVVPAGPWPRRGLLFPEPAALLENARAVQLLGGAAREVAFAREAPTIDVDNRVHKTGQVVSSFERLFPHGSMFTLQPTRGQPFEPKTLKRGRFLKYGGGTLLFEVWEGRKRWGLRLHLTQLSERERAGLVSRFPAERLAGDGVGAWQRTVHGVCAEAQELELHAGRILLAENERVPDLFFTERIALPIAVGEVSSLPKVTLIRGDEHATNIAALYPLAACDLREVVEQYHLPEEVKVEAVRQMLGAVARLHARGVVHLDLKLEHFLLDNHGHVYLGDLTTSEKIIGADVEPSSCEFGALPFLSPEHLACWATQEKKFSPTMATDAWSLGVAIIELWCGETPFRVPNALWNNGPVAVAQYLEELLRRTQAKIDLSSCPGGDITNPEVKRIVAGLLTHDHLKRWLPLDILFTSPLVANRAVVGNGPFGRNTQENEQAPPAPQRH
ncbi:unnamed protein product [Neospora caninum Liverpool]|uniref:Rhoptry kinase family protein ROP45 (Incomplete catalytic triad), putative n=1 Tax=Neospora caninum (strain Liverpool) TaxID=572307 RepID=F0VFS6_NEOCL|nr:uncharacterized protein NCLIV_023580 [Neospora caninum Liverpool]CBZ52570.1 unnamed protein product [Neospora caninum Liverpool]CEL66546.1 TPA: Rhoptry kinase family protein ROP45 (incomplete catalytic triad), putative [Neospora caninum Liverpool]|eukprot:XP_003882602.1 uncharacterized protein NCLIV_023580 [Neospora caninum Liverpool]